MFSESLEFIGNDDMSLQKKFQKKTDKFSQLSKQNKRNTFALVI